MKKILLTALIASVLIVPLGIGNTALADHEEAAVPIQVQEYLPGRSPAETDAAEAMLPAIHGLVLALLNHDTNTLDLTDGALVWEGLYNMLPSTGRWTAVPTRITASCSSRRRRCRTTPLLWTWR